MKRLAALMMAVAPFMAMSTVVDAAEEEPDPLTADIQLVVPDESVNEETVVDVHDYQYSDELDVQRIISIESNSTACGVTPAVMTYEDSHGERHVMRYQVVGYGCEHENG
ncbi:DUF2790 domain-containing protein [Azotobacter chroococcum]|uniref:DUF2790 domain-containing protein n=1 Tax=Azotobacter chroococcum TaxID=353 RepID=A0AA44C7G3_9GAMM|nr:DUF2790 domain-containing protein [Azotobacter chroococcum]NHN78409.1 DUF2790 domain-containing protein [Azotobacter chroococcum]